MAKFLLLQASTCQGYCCLARQPTPAHSSPSRSPQADFDFTLRTLWDLDDFDSSSHSNPPNALRSRTPGGFDFGDREDGLLENHSDGSNDDILGDLARPVDAVKPSSCNQSTRATPSPQAPPLQRLSSRPVSQPPHIVGKIVEMGFSPQQVRITLAATDTGLDVQAALETLLADGAGDSSTPSHTDEVLHLTVGITWAFTIAIACYAFLSKFGGCTIASRLSGFSWRESSTIGALMSCKGLVELIVLNVGLSAGILSPRVFFMFVLEALTLAFMTTPLITALYPPERRLITTAPPQTRDDECRDFDANKKSLVNEEQPWRHRFTVVLDRIEHMLCMMALTQLVRPPIPDFSSLTNAVSTSAASYPTPSKHKTPKVSISALRLVELSNRISAVMKSSTADTLTHTDPLLSIFRMFGELNDLPVSTSLTIVPHDDIPTLLQYFHLLQIGVEQSPDDQEDGPPELMFIHGDTDGLDGQHPPYSSPACHTPAADLTLGGVRSFTSSIIHVLRLKSNISIRYHDLIYLLTMLTQKRPPSLHQGPQIYSTKYQMQETKKRKLEAPPVYYLAAPFPPATDKPTSAFGTFGAGSPPKGTGFTFGKAGGGRREYWQSSGLWIRRRVACRGFLRLHRAPPRNSPRCFTNQVCLSVNGRTSRSGSQRAASDKGTQDDACGKQRLWDAVED
ncbi:hypothetical protein CY34DRAFT_17729 [Suillus luteus UH-Slu-Lm8-n1]|uniref:Unplaced genomic scaffold CY34scaffold_624, whole genome shotgun sequence n=1 Tax=Suillus luteus UH-Slu-Lm8-n1 TaxID=930992 RepID=A0A0D0A8H2_9AGAM|nr:hypothetical protein CY34DRAFT_17729 [Suillus luteus UH-Slu-Lm8-n1]